MRLFVAGLRKLVGRPASLVSVGLLAGLLTLIIVASSTVRPPGDGAEARQIRGLVTFPGAYDGILSFILGLGGLFAVIYGAAIAGSEWTWGTLKSAVARGESRSRYMLLTFAAIAPILAVGVLITFAIGIVAALIGANLAGIATSGLTDAETLGQLPARLLRGWLSIAEEGALGFAIATIARSQLAGIGAGIAFYFGETFATIFVPDVVKYMPFAVARAAVNNGGGGGGFSAGGGQLGALAPDTALVLVAAWLIGSLVVSAVFTERAEISG